MALADIDREIYEKAISAGAPTFDAWFWYFNSQVIDGKTPAALVAGGRREDVMRFLDAHMGRLDTSPGSP